MRFLKPYFLWPTLGLSAVITLATVFLPNPMTTEQVRSGAVWMGKPIKFLSQDFRRYDPPPDYVMNGSFGSPWEDPFRINLFYFLLDVLLIAVPLFLLLILLEKIVFPRSRIVRLVLAVILIGMAAWGLPRFLGNGTDTWNGDEKLFAKFALVQVQHVASESPAALLHIALRVTDVRKVSETSDEPCTYDPFLVEGAFEAHVRAYGPFAIPIATYAVECGTAYRL